MTRLNIVKSVAFALVVAVLVLPSAAFLAREAYWSPRWSADARLASGGATVMPTTSLPAGTVATTRMLEVRVDRDEVAFEYILTAPRSSAVVERALRERLDASEADEFVTTAFGKVELAEFPRGLTGRGLSWVDVAFFKVGVAIAGDVGTVTASSEPIRTYLGNQSLRVQQTPAVTARNDRVLVRAQAAQLLNPVGADLVSTSPTNSALSRTPGKPAVFQLVQSGPSRWVVGLRRFGGITIPVVDGLLSRLASTFGHVLLLLALISTTRPLTPAHAAARQLAGLLVGATVYLAVTQLFYDVTLVWVRKHPSDDWLYAVPTGLLLVGCLVIWPYLCLRKRMSARRTGSRRAVAVGFVTLTTAIGTALHLLVLDPDSSTASSVLQTLAVLSLVTGVWAALTRLVSRGRLRALLVVTACGVAVLNSIFWQTTYYTAYDNRVNAAIKWLHLLVVVFVVVGLAIVVGRAACWAMAAGQWGAQTSAALRAGPPALVLLACGPGLWNTLELDQVSRPGWGPIAVLDLAAYLPSLVDWLLIIFTLWAVASLPAIASETRPLAMRCGIALGVIVLFWNQTYLYVPLTFILAYVVLSRLAFAEGLAARVDTVDLTAVQELWAEVERVENRQKNLSAAREAWRDAPTWSRRRLERRERLIEESLIRLRRQADDLQSKAQRSKLSAFSLTVSRQVPPRCSGASCLGHS